MTKTFTTVNNKTVTLNLSSPIVLVALVVGFLSLPVIALVKCSKAICGF